MCSPAETSQRVNTAPGLATSYPQAGTQPFPFLLPPEKKNKIQGHTPAVVTCQWSQDQEAHSACLHRPPPPGQCRAGTWLWESLSSLSPSSCHLHTCSTAFPAESELLHSWQCSWENSLQPWTSPWLQSPREKAAPRPGSVSLCWSLRRPISAGFRFGLTLPVPLHASLPQVAPQDRCGPESCTGTGPLSPSSWLRSGTHKAPPCALWPRASGLRPRKLRACPQLCWSQKHGGAGRCILCLCQTNTALGGCQRFS